MVGPAGTKNASTKARPGSAGQLSDDIIVEILAKVSEQTASYDAALACRLWNRMSHISQHSVFVREDALLCEELLLRELSSMPNLRSIVLGKQSVTQLTDSFFRGVGENFKELEHIEVVEGAVLHGGSVSGLGLRALFEGADSPPQRTFSNVISGLPRLKTLKLRGCENLRWSDLPASSAMSGLQELELSLAGQMPSGRRDVLALASFIKELALLKKLFLRSHCMRFLPQEIGGLQKLRSLTIKMPQLEALPSEIGNLQSLKCFSLFSRAITALPDTFIRLKSLQQLILECKLLRELPAGVGAMIDLRLLSVAGWRSSTQLPEAMFRLPRLVRLETASSIAHSHQMLSVLAPSLRELSCHSLWHTPDLVLAMAALTGLKKLILSGPCVGKFPEKLGINLTALEELSLEKLEGMTELPQSFGYLRRLRILSMSVCPVLASLPETMGSLTALEEVKLSYCRSLASLPESIARLNSLKRLSISFCLSLALLPGGGEGFHALEDLQVSQWAGPGLWADRSELAGVGSPGRTPSASRLRKLSVSSSTLQHLPHNLGKFSELEELALHCDSLGQLPASVLTLKKLRLLCLSGARIRRLPEDLHLMSSLEKLSIERRGCPILEALPDNITRLASLQVLSLFSCSGLRELPEGVGVLPNLRELRLGTEHRRIDGSRSMGSSGQAGSWDPVVLSKTAAHCMDSLPDSICAAQALKVLEIINLKPIKALPEDLGSIQGLQRLIISHCPELRSLPDSLGALRNLQELHIIFLPLLQCLPDDLRGLRSMKTLHLRHCPLLETLPASLGSVLNLTQLHLEGLDSLLVLPPLDPLRGLVEFRISQCPHLSPVPQGVLDLPLLSAPARASLEELNSVALAQSTSPGRGALALGTGRGDEGQRCVMM